MQIDLTKAVPDLQADIEEFERERVRFRRDDYRLHQQVLDLMHHMSLELLEQKRKIASLEKLVASNEDMLSRLDNRTTGLIRLGGGGGAGGRYTINEPVIHGNGGRHG